MSAKKNHPQKNHPQKNKPPKKLCKKIASGLKIMFTLFVVLQTAGQFFSNKAFYNLANKAFVNNFSINCSHSQMIFNPFNLSANKSCDSFFISQNNKKIKSPKNYPNTNNPDQLPEYPYNVVLFSNIVWKYSFFSNSIQAKFEKIKVSQNYEMFPTSHSHSSINKNLKNLLSHLAYLQGNMKVDLTDNSLTLKLKLGENKPKQTKIPNIDNIANITVFNHNNVATSIPNFSIKNLNVTVRKNSDEELKIKINSEIIISQPNNNSNLNLTINNLFTISDFFNLNSYSSSPQKIIDKKIKQSFIRYNIIKNYNNEQKIKNIMPNKQLLYAPLPVPSLSPLSVTAKKPTKTLKCLKYIKKNQPENQSDYGIKLILLLFYYCKYNSVSDYISSKKIEFNSNLKILPLDNHLPNNNLNTNSHKQNIEARGSFYIIDKKTSLIAVKINQPEKIIRNIIELYDIKEKLQQKITNVLFQLIKKPSELTSIEENTLDFYNYPNPNKAKTKQSKSFDTHKYLFLYRYGKDFFINEQRFPDL